MNYKKYHISLVFWLIVFFSYVQRSAAQQVPQSGNLSLQDAQQRALQNNHLLKVQREKLNETRWQRKEAATLNKPQLFATGMYIYNGITKDYSISKGSLGQVAGIPFPTTDIPLSFSKHNLLVGSVLAYQPISQLGKIGIGIDVAEEDIRIQELQVNKTQLEINNGVEKAYLALLLEQKKLDAAGIQIELTRASLYDVESALLAGKTDPVNKIGLEAELAHQEEDSVTIWNQIEDYTADLKELMGEQTGPGRYILQDLAYQDTAMNDLKPLDEYLQAAQQNNPDILIAGRNIQKSTLGIAASKKDNIPDIGLTGGYTYQNVLPVLPYNNYFVGVNLAWNIYDFGRKRAKQDQYASKKAQAEEYLAYMRTDIRSQVEKAYRKATQSYRLIPIAQRAVDYRREAYRLKKDKADAGLALKKDLLETGLAQAKAEQDLYAARLGYRLALIDLQKLTGLYQ